MTFSSTGRCGRSRPPARHPALAAIAWRHLDGAADPIIPFGRLRGMLLCQHVLRDGRMPLLLRELHPTIDLRSARCQWTSGPVVCDLSLNPSDLGNPLSLKPWQQTHRQWAEVLLAALRDHPVGREPILPYTLAAIPNEGRIQPRPTKAIERIAMESGEPWHRVWERLQQERGVEAKDQDVQWIDTRLCDRLKGGVTWPGAVALAHDLRDIPRLHVWRPPLQASVPESLLLNQPQGTLDGWNAPESVMHRLGMEHFMQLPLPAPAPQFVLVG